MASNDSSIDLKDIFKIEWKENTDLDVENCQSGIIGDNGCITGFEDESDRDDAIQFNKTDEVSPDDLNDDLNDDGTNDDALNQTTSNDTSTANSTASNNDDINDDGGERRRLQKNDSHANDTDFDLRPEWQQLNMTREEYNKQLAKEEEEDKKNSL